MHISRTVFFTCLECWCTTANRGPLRADSSNLSSEWPLPLFLRCRCWTRQAPLRSRCAVLQCRFSAVYETFHGRFRRPPSRSDGQNQKRRKWPKQLDGSFLSEGKNKLTLDFSRSFWLTPRTYTLVLTRTGMKVNVKWFRGVVWRSNPEKWTGENGQKWLWRYAAQEAVSCDGRFHALAFPAARGHSATERRPGLFSLSACVSDKRKKPCCELVAVQ